MVGTLLPFQHYVTRSALKDLKKGLVSCSQKVVCLFPVKSSKVVKGNFDTLVLMWSSRDEDRLKPEGSRSIRYVTFPVNDAAMIVDLYPSVKRVSVDVRWVAVGDELMYIIKVMSKIQSSVSHLHFSGVPNTLEHDLTTTKMPMKCNVVFEFVDTPRKTGNGCEFV